MPHVPVLLQQIESQIRGVPPILILGICIADQVPVGRGVGDEAIEQDLGRCLADLDVGACGECGEGVRFDGVFGEAGGRLGRCFVDFGEGADLA